MILINPVGKGFFDNIRDDFKFSQEELIQTGGTGAQLVSCKINIRPVYMILYTHDEYYDYAQDNWSTSCFRRQNENGIVTRAT
ncbi:MAG: hypothetical protein L0H53_12935 [Candidatus Nitrosocosmicus sp.]|nr:hypothetical protein [Candidatus Nitrosocosmicus sp.]